MQKQRNNKTSSYTKTKNFHQLWAQPWKSDKVSFELRVFEEDVSEQNKLVYRKHVCFENVEDK